MQFAFLLVAVLVAMVCTNEDHDASAMAVSAHANKKVPRTNYALAEGVEKETKLELLDWANQEQRSDVIDALSQQLANHQLVRRQVQAPNMGMMSSSSADSSGDSMSMSMSSDAAAAAAGGMPRVGQLMEPELLLTGEMLRRLEEQALGYSFSGSQTTMTSCVSCIASLFLALILAS